VKRQLAVVTVDSDIVGVFRKIQVFTNVRYAVCCTFTVFTMAVPLMLVKNTVDGFLCAEFRIVECFSRCSIHYVNVVRCPNAHVSYERAHQNHVKKQINVLEMVQRSPTTGTRRFSTRLGTSRTCVWRTLPDDGLYPFQPQRVQNLDPGDSAMRLDFCHLLHTNYQFLPYDEVTFTRNGISNTHNSHW
jgi:hypothetical protein